MPQSHSSHLVRTDQPSPPISQANLPLRNLQRQPSGVPAHRHGHVQHPDTQPNVALLPPKAPRPFKPQPELTVHSHHARSHSSLPQVKTPQVITPAISGSSRTRKSIVTEIEEPEFVKEEREAWRRKSPRGEQGLESWSRSRNSAQTTRVSYPNPGIVLHPPSQSSEPPPQPRKQSKQTLPLREFAPLLRETNIEERPKTSRGSSSVAEPDMRSRCSQDSQDNIMGTQATRKSRFLEGSLTDRSGAVASSWYESDSVSGESYESDVMRRPSKEMRKSGSFESRDSRDPPKTPATAMKKRLFGLRNSFKSGERNETLTDQCQVPKKKGLRKSLSTWNFHNLGDKMKIFGGSTVDLTPRTSKDKHKLPKTPAKDSATTLLDERKRKAEEAYSQQFGLKKQKSNSGMANSMTISQESLTPKLSSLKHRTIAPSSLTSSANSRSRVTSYNTTLSRSSECSSSDLNNIKRPSRQELEKENRHLRRILRQTSSMQFDAHRSSFHLPLYADPSTENTPRLSQEDFAQGHKMRVSPGKKMGRRGEDVPPVPKLSREVLGSLENGWNTRARSADGQKTLPRPVSMILEEEEMKDVGQMVDSARDMDIDMPPAREPWEWPDDVF